MKRVVAILLILMFATLPVGFATSDEVVIMPDNYTNDGNTNTNNDNNNSHMSSTINNITGNSNIDDTINNVGNKAMIGANNILDLIAQWSLPFCAIAVVYGAVQYFILGIRNLYKKRQGLLLMWGSITLYVIIVFVNLILTFMMYK